MRLLNFLIIVSISCTTLCAQNTWSSNIAQLVYDNCSSCHNPNGIAPFSLLNYTDAKTYSATIRTAVSLKTMPPWIADREYQSYSHERVLEESEIKAITDWVDAGAPEGDPSKTPPPPVYSTKGYITLEPDLELRMPTYASKATNKADDYICFSVPSGLTKNKKIRAFEVIPGNHNIVHHTLVYLDATGNYKTDTSGGVCTGPTTGLIGGYVPGSPPTIFPANHDDFNLGFEVKAGSNIVLAMHYPEGSYGIVDSTKIRFWFYEDDEEIRELRTESLIENWQFALPPNQKTDVSDTRLLNDQEYSMLSVFPHMHLLGSEIRSYAITPSKDTIKFVNITHWDFEWQEFLFFNRMKKIPRGTVIHGEGTYDNSSNNHHNPNDPPILVRPGLNTSDEMFLIYFHYLPYEAGDENRDIESMHELASSTLGYNKLPVRVFPNPVHNQLTFQFDKPFSQDDVQISIYDLQGKLVQKITTQNSLPQSSSSIIWNIPEELSAGSYFYSINFNGAMGSGMFLLQAE